MARKSLYITYFKWYMVSSGAASTRAKRMRTRAEPLCRCYPFLILTPQASHWLLSQNKCWGRQDPYVPQMVYPRLSFCQVQRLAFLITQWKVSQGQTPTTPGVSVHTENKAVCNKASTLLCSSYSCRLVPKQNSKMRWSNPEIEVVIRSPWTTDAHNVFHVNPLVTLFHI